MLTTAVLEINGCDSLYYLKPKAIIAGIAKNPVVQEFFIHFFIDNSNPNISLHTLSCPKLKFGQLKAYKLMFGLELSMKKLINFFWIAGFSVIPAIIASGFR